MTFEEWADQNINTNQSAYTAAKAGWRAALKSISVSARHELDSSVTVLVSEPSGSIVKITIFHDGNIAIHGAGF